MNIADMEDIDSSHMSAAIAVAVVIAVIAVGVAAVVSVAFHWLQE